MKSLLGIGVIAVLAFGLIYTVNAKTAGPNDYYLVIKFEQTGNTIALADKFDGHDACITSPDFMLHQLAGKQSGSLIKCINELPTYR
jgi:hypothetical protein